MEQTDKGFTIQGLALSKIAEEYGTPIFVYDTAKMEAQYNKLLRAFDGNDLKIKYAVKALNNINVLKFFKSLGAGLDTVSIQEVMLGLHAGFDPAEIIYTPNCVSMDEIDLAVDLGVVVNIDNISILDQFGHKYGSTVPVCIRINPHIMAGGHQQISTGHIDSKFGISIHQLRHVERIMQANKIEVTGLHMHTGSDILDTEVFLRGAEILFEAASFFPDLEFVDFGSGFKVAYKEDDITTDLEDLGPNLTLRFQAFCRQYGRPLQLYFEPGKFLVSEAGYFIVKTNVVKQTTATIFAGVDSGLNHLIRPMLYNSYHHIVNLSNPTGIKRVYTVVGYICETDTFAWDRKIAEIREGDLLVFQNAGAYGYTMSSNYNSRFRPAEVMIHAGEVHQIRRREALEDLLRNQVELSIF